MAAIMDFWSECFFLLDLPWYILPSFESISLSIQEKKFKIDFQDGGYGGHLGFPICYFSKLFVTSHLNTTMEFLVNWAFV